MRFSVPRRTGETAKFSDGQILVIVKEDEAGREVAHLCRANGITEQTYYSWKARYGRSELTENAALKQLEDEAEAHCRRGSARYYALKAVIKKVVGPIAPRENWALASSGHVFLPVSIH
jgi:hypothetical protein